MFILCELDKYTFFVSIECPISYLGISNFSLMTAVKNRDFIGVYDPLMKCITYANPSNVIYYQ